MTSVFTGLLGTWFADFVFAHHISNVQLVRNKKSCAGQYVPPGWFEECDHGVLECQFLHDSDTVKSSKLKYVRWKLNIWLLRRHLYTIQCHMTTLWYRSWLFWQFWLTALAIMNRIFHSKMAVTARAAARARSSKQNTRAACFACIYGPPSYKIAG